MKPAPLHLPAQPVPPKRPRPPLGPRFSPIMVPFFSDSPHRPHEPHTTTFPKPPHAPPSAGLGCGTAYCCVHERAVCLAATSSAFHALATSAASGSSGLGAPRSAEMERRMVRIWSAGDQLSDGASAESWGRMTAAPDEWERSDGDQDLLLSTSRQMRPSLSTLGW
jgi:hypothetical protein